MFARGGDQNFICRAKTIPRYSFRELFNLKDNRKDATQPPHIFMHVPIFQRRYCWGTAQVRNFIADAIKISYKPVSRDDWLKGQTKTTIRLHGGGNNKSHSFGRVVVSERDEDNGLKVVDGQQRMTTVCLFLSSVRDYFSTRGLSQDLCTKIDNVLFPLGREKRCILTPTYFDQEPFSACVNGIDALREYLSNHGNKVNSDIIFVRRMFDSAIENGSIFKRVAGKFADTPLDENNHELLELSAMSVLQAVLDGFNVLFFKMMDKSNTMNSYFRLAIREFGLINSMFSIDSPGVGMATADLIRNLLLTCFHGEKKQLFVYKTYWAPIEKIARMTGLEKDQDKNVNMVKNMTIMLNNFIASENPEIIKKGENAQAKLKWQDPSIVLFPLYTKLLTCIEGELSVHGVEVPVVLSKVTPEIENIVLKWLQKFKAFADKTFGSESVLSMTGGKRDTGGVFRGERKGKYLSSMDENCNKKKNIVNSNCSNSGQNSGDKRENGGVFKVPTTTNKKINSCWCEARGTKCVDCIVAGSVAT